MFSALIQANLTTRRLGRQIESYTRLESTNTEALELEEKGAADGTVVTTDIQSAGRGRRGRNWFSLPGKSATFSVIVKPLLPAESLGLLSLAAGVAVAEALEKLSLSPTLKWPNDVLLSEKKCSGILSETRLLGGRLAAAVIGIGLNVNETLADFPEELRPTATSLAVEKGSVTQRELVTAWILNALEVWLDRLAAGETGALIEAWLGRCAHLGRDAVYTRGADQGTARFEGIGATGEAVLVLPTGERLTAVEEITLTG